MYMEREQYTSQKMYMEGEQHYYYNHILAIYIKV